MKYTRFSSEIFGPDILETLPHPTDSIQFVCRENDWSMVRFKNKSNLKQIRLNGPNSEYIQPSTKLGCIIACKSTSVKTGHH